LQQGRELVHAQMLGPTIVALVHTRMVSPRSRYGT
jgi:hypothetical protein